MGIKELFLKKAQEKKLEEKAIEDLYVELRTLEELVSQGFVDNKTLILINAIRSEILSRGEMLLNVLTEEI